MRLLVIAARDSAKLTVGSCVIDAGHTPETTASALGAHSYTNGAYTRLGLQRPDDGFALTLHYRDDRLSAVVVSPLPEVQSEAEGRRVLQEMQIATGPLALPSWLFARWAFELHSGQPLLELSLQEQQRDGASDKVLH